MRSEHSDAIDLTLYPLVANASMLNLGVLRTGGVCAFGRWRGTVRFDGTVIHVHELIGWAEEFAHRW